MRRFPGYEKSLCANLTATKQEEEKDRVYEAASSETKSSRRELSKYIFAKVNRILKVNHDE